MRKIALVAFALAALAASPGRAQMVCPSTTNSAFCQAVPSYVGPGDIKTNAWGWWSVVRGYSAAYAAPGTNPAFDYACTGGSPATGTINVLPTGLTDTSTLNTNCGANTVTYSKIYDQSGNTRHLTQSTGANQPSRVKTCIAGTFDCAKSTTGQSLNSAGTFTINDPVSVTGAVQRVGGSGGNSSTYVGGSAPGNTDLGTWGSGGSNFILLWGSNNGPGATATDSVFHSVVGCVTSAQTCNGNGANNGVISVDGTATAGTGTVNISAQTIFWNAPTSETFEMGEGGIWNSVFSATDFTNMCHNMRAFYATPGSC